MAICLVWAGPWQLCISLAYHGQGNFNRNYLIDKILQILIALQTAIAEYILFRLLLRIKDI